ncbi:endonuclease/exonuclease/phosphatase [Oceanococcus atlanticus]|uniref:Altered inheritance of mitochondria protein 6 n=1 Tax=Oceanococcus atlanticus TaxID=1317117 RepID=A0A1Y1SD62_9GAMM|nr:phosphatidylinositol-specific phospholipase C/glycerophosphodiester phosphodiesterase family protein [Oceanococcus atlanticus]ORE86936.1 endonuclease/exonuclease/phosphatase [Oceanococcus atlanticus]
MLRSILSLGAVLAITACGGRESSDQFVGFTDEPLHQAHAHNDYLHERPLLDALEHGFMSIEADVFAFPLLGDALYVAHDINDIRPGRTLRTLYLEPIRQRIDTLGALQSGQDRPLQLLIDFKSSAESTWRALDAALQPYASYLTRFENGRIVEGWVSVVISGNRPTQTLASAGQRLAFIDGRLSDLDAPPPNDLMPLISDNWANHFDWRGEGAMPADEYDNLQQTINSAHLYGYRLRFWNTPDAAGPARTALWQVLYDLGVDHINTDDLAGLAQFLRNQAPRD